MLCSAPLFSQGEYVMGKNDLAFTAGVGSGFFSGAIDVSGGIEYIVAEHEVGDKLPLSYGVAGKFNYYRYNYQNYTEAYHYTYIGGGGFGTVHFGLNALDLEKDMRWLGNFDPYVGLGIGFFNYSNTYDDDLNNTYDRFQMGLRSIGGVNYFFSPNFAVTLEGGYYGRWGGGLIGVLFKW